MMILDRISGIIIIFSWAFLEPLDGEYYCYDFIKQDKWDDYYIILETPRGCELE